MAMMRRVFIGTLLAVLLFAQNPGAVVVDGRELWRFVVPNEGFSPEDRALDVRASLVRVAEDQRMNLADLREFDTGTETFLLVGRVYLFSVTDDDARQNGTERASLFQERKKIAIDAIHRYREAREYSALLRMTMFGAGAFLGAVVALMLLWRLYRAGMERSEAGLARMAATPRLGKLHQLFEAPLRWAAWLLLRVLFGVLALVIAFAAFSYILRLVPATSAVADSLIGRTIDLVTEIGQAALSYLPNLGVLLLIFAFTYVALVVARGLRQALGTGLLTIPGFYTDWAEPTYALVRVLLILFALVLAFPYLPGGDSPALRGVSIFLGVLVSLGSGSATGNAIAGVILTYMRPYRVGDRVKIADSVGDIVKRSLLVTRVRTIKNVEVIVPNSAVLGAHIVNYSANARDHGLILHTTVTIGYDAPWPKVHQLLIAAALKTEGIQAEPKPFVLQTSLNDYHVSYEINAYTERANEMARIYSDLHANIQDSFNAGGVEILSPGYHALRDGNSVTIPEAYRDAGYRAPGFRVERGAGK